jgi:YVTN family beta-propeller protein
MTRLARLTDCAPGHQNGRVAGRSVQILSVLLMVALTACGSTIVPTSTALPTGTQTPIPGGSSPSTATQTPIPTSTPKATPVARVGTVMRVMAQQVAVASSLGKAPTADVIRAGELVQVVGGPGQVGGTRWWQVRVAALTGWVSEGDPAHPDLLVASAPASRAWNVWSATTTNAVSPSVADLPARVYVPNEADNTISVIDPISLKVIATLAAGRLPEHLTPDWDMSRLYVSNYASSFLTVVDPRTETTVSPIPAPSAYNLYFSPDGSKAIVMAEDVSRIDFYDRKTWKLLKRLPIKWAGIDHADFSAGGRYLLASTEYAGHVLKVDVVTMSIVGDLAVGGKPIDVKLSPDGSVFFVTNQGRSGVSVIDPILMREVAFIRTATGAHGMAISRDTRKLYVSNRLVGTISVIDFSTRRVTATWVVGGSPDMLQVSPNGRQLWTGNRYSNTVVVIDTTSGRVIATIRVGLHPHGLTYFPQPGRFSIGHNGVYR